ncbi:MAG: sugar transferase [Acidobacteria bacterium]|nr:sugar transferase [Acidobacteriota bacterium]
MKRLLDLTVAFTGLMLFSPLLVAAATAVWLENFSFPFYLGWRIGKNGRKFRMSKLRTMVVNADRNGVNSTAADDPRLTRIGRFLRASKMDELPQLWNVLKGDMSLVGPRPQVLAESELYTSEERCIFAARPGITDLSSIVFADEGEILRGSPDPDLLYNQVIRPWKSRLALLYVQKRSFGADLYLLALTTVSFFSRKMAMAGVGRLLRCWNADPLLTEVASRQRPLTAYPPPGAESILVSYPRPSRTSAVL